MYENNTWPSVHGALSGSDGSKPAPSSKIALVLDFATIRAPVDRRVPSENDENDCNGSILLKKYPQKNCRIGNRNERIQTSRLLNQNCAVALELESMLLSIPLQIPFSTVSVESRCGAVAVGRTYLFPPLSSGGALVVQP